MLHALLLVLHVSHYQSSVAELVVRIAGILIMLGTFSFR
jgi:hypothetical protein